MMQYNLKPKVLIAPITTEILKEINIGAEVVILVSHTIMKNFNLQSIFEDLRLTSNLHIYDHIRPDVPFDDLDQIINELNSKKIDNIIAIGGGSVIDAAKTLSVSFEGISYKDLFYKKADMPNRKINVTAIPTTAGTGAELSFGAIIYDNYNNIKGGIRGEIVQPDNVLIDAKFHNNCPFKLKAEVGFDCLTHAVETYISKKSNPLVRIQSVSCIKNVFKYLIPACTDNDSYAMEKIAISSALMGLNLAYSSTCLPHRIQYVIGPLTHTSHAQGLIAIYKGWLKYLAEINLMELESLAVDLDMTIPEFLEKIAFLKEELKINYSISDLGVKKYQIKEISESVTGNVSADPSYKDTNTIYNILINAL